MGNPQYQLRVLKRQEGLAYAGAIGRCRLQRRQAGRNHLLALDKLPNARVFWPDGTFYFFFSVHGMNSGYDMARRILKEAGVGVAPGSAFGPGGEEFLRVCFAVDPALIEEGAKRLEAFLCKQQ
jgi:aspartate/methionine/tyrosine aminotransferase